MKSNHWARGYINLAVSVDVGGSAGEDGETTGGVKLIRGMADGTFQPDRAITYAEAVTILMRVLGYSDTDAGRTGPRVICSWRPSWASPTVSPASTPTAV